MIEDIQSIMKFDLAELTELAALTAITEINLNSNFVTTQFSFSVSFPATH